MFVLIHGGGHSSRCWEPTAPLLDGSVRALDLVGRGEHPMPLDQVRLHHWIDTAVADIEATGSADIVLVGHSMAGLAMAGIVERVHPLLRHVVFVSCAIPPDGGSLLDLVPPEVRELSEAAVPTAEGVLLDAATTRAMQCYDMTDDQADFTCEVVVPEAYYVIRDPVDLTGFRRAVPKTWVQLLGDQTFSPDLQAEMAGRAGCHEIIPLDSGHVAMISHPAELAAVLNSIIA